jgi:hypothetical protein
MRASPIVLAVTIGAATALPWATYRDLRTGHVTTLTAGRWGVVVVVTAGICAVLAAWFFAHESVPVRRACVLVGCIAVCECIVTALSRISAANRLADHAALGSGSETAYAVGGFVGTGAALAFVATIAAGSARAGRQPS